MKNIIEIFKTFLGKYKIKHEYWVKLDEIKIPAYYKKTKIRKNKWIRKLNYWRQTGKFESPILIDKHFNLVDGFSSCKIAYLNNVKKVPVQFVEK